MKLGVSQSLVQSDATNIIPCLGQVTFATVAVSSPLPSRSGRQLARSGSSAEDVLALSWWLEQCPPPGRDHQVARCLRVLRHVWTAGGAAGVVAAGVRRSSWCCRCSSSTRWLTFSCSSSSSSPGCARAVHRQIAGHFSCAQRGTHSANCAEDCSWRQRPCDQQRQVRILLPQIQLILRVVNIVVVQQISIEIPQVQFLVFWEVVDMPVNVQRQVLSF